MEKNIKIDACRQNIFKEHKHIDFKAILLLTYLYLPTATYCNQSFNEQTNVGML
jgi:ABC-type spermidine/putrescine transport system permease subunit II